MIITLLLVAGGVGALLLFVGDGLIRTRLGRNFPWGNFIINASGSFLFGIITGLALHHHTSATTKLILGTGFCGGYTTFSTASFETVRLIEDNKYWSAAFSAFETMVSAVFVREL
jgi:CrcB protein